MRHPNTHSAQRLLSLEEYLRWEDRNTVKHEYVRGEVYAMSGRTKRHARIAGNILARLVTATRGGRCQVFGSDMKVRAREDVAYYPDVSVECGEFDAEDVISEQPVLVVEVTSRGTMRVDRGEKLDNYRQISSLQSYLIVDQNRRRVSHHFRTPAGWLAQEFEGAEIIRLACLNVDLALDEIYESIVLPPLGVAEPEIDEETGEYIVEH